MYHPLYIYINVDAVVGDAAACLTQEFEMYLKDC